MNLQINSLNTYFFEIITNDVINGTKSVTLNKQNCDIELMDSDSYIIIHAPNTSYFIAKDLPSKPECLAVSEVSSVAVTSNSDLYTKLKAMIIT